MRRWLLSHIMYNLSFSDVIDAPGSLPQGPTIRSKVLIGLALERTSGVQVLTRWREDATMTIYGRSPIYSSSGMAK